MKTFSKIIYLLIISYFTISPFFVFSALAPQTVINEETKQCAIFGPSTRIDLPNGWHVFNNPSDSKTVQYFADFKNYCEKNNYTFLSNFEGNIKIKYRILNFSLILVSIITLILITKRYIYNKEKRSYLKFFFLLLLACLVLFLILNLANFIMDPCYISFC